MSHRQTWAVHHIQKDNVVLFVCPLLTLLVPYCAYLYIFIVVFAGHLIPGRARFGCICSFVLAISVLHGHSAGLSSRWASHGLEQGRPRHHRLHHGGGEQTVQYHIVSCHVISYRIIPDRITSLYTCYICKSYFYRARNISWVSLSISIKL